MSGGDDLAAVLTSIGLDPKWSRCIRLDAPGAPEVHVLDREGSDPGTPTVVCVHGNPTWAALWTPLLTGLDPALRVIALDQVDMGWSQRVTPAGAVRRYETRIADLDAALAALEVHGPVVLVGHDWGGAVAMGWATRHPGRVAGLVLANTGIAVPEGRRAPGLIRLAARPGLRTWVTRRTSVFVGATARLPGPGPSAPMRAALRAAYTSASQRHGIDGFVADIPFDEDHPSATALAEVADRLGEITAPVLLVWGARDPVFDDTFAHDLSRRFTDAELHRHPRNGHLSPLGDDFAGIVGRWLDRRLLAPAAPLPRGVEAAPAPPTPRAWTRLERRRQDDSLAFHDATTGESVTFAELETRVMRCARGLWSRGVRAGDRVGVLVPPGVDLVTVVYACWRIGAVTVIADRGLGLSGLGAALRSARVTALVGIARALRVAGVARWAPGALTVEVGALTSATDPVHSHDDLDIPEPPRDAEAAVLFTSGATGPAKGVRYTHGQLEAQCEALMALYGITPEDRLVAAFAPFSLYGPAMGIASALPRVDVTAPATLTATALDSVCDTVDATLVFASPAALTNVVATAGGRRLEALARVRRVMSAGAPIPVPLLEQVSALVPDASLHTPYGMTEVLPVADVDLDELHAVGAGQGVCVGRPVPRTEVMIAEPGHGPLVPCDPGVTGEVVIAAPWCSAGYDVLADTQARARPRIRSGSSPDEGAWPATDVVWHRSGDLGHLDEEGRLWIEGRVAHGIETAQGLVTPVPLELAAEEAPGVARAAAVGVGPRGVHQIVIVVETASRHRLASVRRSRVAPARPRVRLASMEMSTAVRSAVSRRHLEVRIAAVLEAERLPVDVRHNAKIDRTALSTAADRFLAGGR